MIVLIGQETEASSSIYVDILIATLASVAPLAPAKKSNTTRKVASKSASKKPKPKATTKKAIKTLQCSHLLGEDRVRCGNSSNPLNRRYCTMLLHKSARYVAIKLSPLEIVACENSTQQGLSSPVKSARFQWCKLGARGFGIPVHISVRVLASVQIPLSWRYSDAYMGAPPLQPKSLVSQLTSCYSKSPSCRRWQCTGLSERPATATLVLQTRRVDSVNLTRQYIVKAIPDGEERRDDRRPYEFCQERDR
ncbi:unnamed protein product [Phytophthora lilii]|uniref:Unnamed protein product n=1 Tax=Phytophthora lilii TaxID=2077276 RepID=A0A9W6WME4_9STRA|nr:unnamed protein product [Phytophthora lilii]